MTAHIFIPRSDFALYLGALSKIDMNTGEILLRKINAIPEEFVKKGYDHIGDISWHNGLIYAPVEDLQEEQPLVLLYDAETLEYTGTYFELDNTYLPDGIPWCTVDADNGYLYASPFKNVTCIVAFNLSDELFAHYSLKRRNNKGSGQPTILTESFM